MKQLTEQKIDETLEKLKASPSYKSYDMTAEEARQYLSKEFIERWNLHEDWKLRMFANTSAETNYSIDREFLISCYNVLKQEKIKEKQQESSRLYLQSIGVVV